LLLVKPYYYTVEEIKRRYPNKLLYPHRTCFISFEQGERSLSPLLHFLRKSMLESFSAGIAISIWNKLEASDILFVVSCFACGVVSISFFVVLLYPFCRNLTSNSLVRYTLLAPPSAPEFIDSTQFRH
jgi:hypothetical protein